MSLEAAQERHKSLGRNDVCSCGSGKKYKKCHRSEDDAEIAAEFKRLEEVAEAAALAAAEEAEEAEDNEEAGKVATKGRAANAAKKGRARPMMSGKGGPTAGKGSRTKSLPRRAAV